MNGDTRARVDAALAELIDAGPDERSRAIGELRSHDPVVAAQVDALLSCAPDADAFFSRFPSERDDSYSPVIGRRVGAYRITGELGRGGMGAVYRARRDDGQFSREVAIKFISVLAAGSDAWRRFEREKRLMAAISHPNIAQLLDAGTSDEGVPYIVMQLIEGEPIDAFCRRRALDLTNRLRLFRLVCEAVQFTHRNLIVHCDIKPANVLVTADGTPKVLDFGVSRMVSQDEVTAPQQRLMTLDYASPEQIRGEPVTVATDIYSLGVLLYVLVTGVNPQHTSGASPTETIRRICEQDPPSLRTAARGVSRDLDAIVLKAVAKAPVARYGSVEELGADIQRFLERRPILARPASAVSRVTRFVNRNRLLSGVAAALLLAVCGGLVAFAWQARVANEQRAVAEYRFEQGRRFAQGVLYGLHDQIAQAGGSVEARRLLVTQSIKYLESLGVQTADDPALRRELAAAYRRLADIQGGAQYFSLGDTSGALHSLQRARDLLAPALDDDSAARELVQIYLVERSVHTWARNDRAERDAASRALRLAQELASRSPHGLEERFLLASAHMAIAFRSDDAPRSFEAARELLERLVRERPGEDRFRQGLAQLEHDFGSYHVTYGGGFETALPHLRRAFELNAELESRHRGDRRIRMDVSMNCYLIAVCLSSISAESAATAESFAERSVKLRRELAAEDPQDERIRERLAAALVVLGHSRWAAGKHAQAAEQFREALSLVQRLDPKLRSLPGAAATRAHSQLGIARFEQERGNGAAACAAFVAANRAFTDLPARRRYPFERAQQQAAARGAGGCAPESASVSRDGGTRR